MTDNDERDPWHGGFWAFESKKARCDRETDGQHEYITPLHEMAGGFTYNKKRYSYCKWCDHEQVEDNNAARY